MSIIIASKEPIVVINDRLFALNDTSMMSHKAARKDQLASPSCKANKNTIHHKNPQLLKKLMYHLALDLVF